VFFWDSAHEWGLTVSNVMSFHKQMETMCTGPSIAALFEASPSLIHDCCQDTFRDALKTVAWSTDASRSCKLTTQLTDCPVDWMVQSAEWFSLSNGPVSWKVQSAEWFSLLNGPVSWMVQSAEWFSLLNGPISCMVSLLNVQSAQWSNLLNGPANWMVQSAE
jgi:hypothetical protein